MRIKLTEIQKTIHWRESNLTKNNTYTSLLVNRFTDFIIFGATIQFYNDIFNEFFADSK